MNYDLQVRSSASSGLLTHGLSFQDNWEYYSAIKTDTHEKFVGKWMYLETMIVSALNQKNYFRYYMVFEKSEIKIKSKQKIDNRNQQDRILVYKSVN